MHDMYFLLPMISGQKPRNQQSLRWKKTKLLQYLLYTCTKTRKKLLFNTYVKQSTQSCSSFFPACVNMVFLCVLWPECGTPRPLSAADCRSACTWLSPSRRPRVPCPPGAWWLWTACRTTRLPIPGQKEKQMQRVIDVWTRQSRAEESFRKHPGRIKTWW